jgi:hypothetical protein
MLTLVLQRTLVSAGVHALASGVVGGFVGLAHMSRGAVTKVAWTVAGLVIGTALHGGWSVALSTVAGVGGRWPVLAAMPVLYALYLGALWLFLRWEHGVLHEQLVEEANLGLVPPWVLARCPSPAAPGPTMAAARRARRAVAAADQARLPPVPGPGCRRKTPWRPRFSACGSSAADARAEALTPDDGDVNFVEAT